MCSMNIITVSHSWYISHVATGAHYNCPHSSYIIVIIISKLPCCTCLFPSSDLELWVSMATLSTLSQSVAGQWSRGTSRRLVAIRKFPVFKESRNNSNGAPAVRDISKGSPIFWAMLLRLGETVMTSWLVSPMMHHTMVSQRERQLNKPHTLRYHSFHKKINM